MGFTRRSALIVATTSTVLALTAGCGAPSSPGGGGGDSNGEVPEKPAKADPEMFVWLEDLEDRNAAAALLNEVLDRKPRHIREGHIREWCDIFPLRYSVVTVRRTGSLWKK